MNIPSAAKCVPAALTLSRGAGRKDGDESGVDPHDVHTTQPEAWERPGDRTAAVGRASGTIAACAARRRHRAGTSDQRAR